MALPKTSFAMVQTAQRKLEPRDLLIPDIDDDSALLKLKACGTCGACHQDPRWRDS
jgi:hypothetical protein